MKLTVEASAGSRVAIERRRVRQAIAGRVRRRLARARAQPAHRRALALAERARRFAAAAGEAPVADRLSPLNVTLHPGESPLTYFSGLDADTRTVRRPRRAHARPERRLRDRPADPDPRLRRSCRDRQTFAGGPSRRSADRRHLGLRIFGVGDDGFPSQAEERAPNGASKARSQSARDARRRSCCRSARQQADLRVRLARGAGPGAAAAAARAPAADERGAGVGRRRIANPACPS